MKTAACFRSLATCCALFFAVMASAQTAALQADSTALAAAGGTVKLTAGVSYDAQPGAIGWTIALPTGWSLVSVGGANVPELAPVPGATGNVEFVYTTVPAKRVEFTVVVQYPAGVVAAKATSTALVRTSGKLATLTPAPVEFGSK